MTLNIMGLMVTLGIKDTQSAQMTLIIRGVMVTLSINGTQYNGLDGVTQPPGTHYYHTQLVVLSIKCDYAK